MEQYTAAFNLASVQAAAHAGQIEIWVDRYLRTSIRPNVPLADGLQLERRWWVGPRLMSLDQLTRVWSRRGDGVPGSCPRLGALCHDVGRWPDHARGVATAYGAASGWDAYYSRWQQPPRSNAPARVDLLLGATMVYK